MKEVKFLSTISGHALFGYLQELAFIDEKKPASKKGMTLFKNDPKNFGNKIVRLALETLIHLG